MNKNLLIFATFSFLVFSSFLSAELKYDVQDIGTLQTHSSQTIAINNERQVLGWYNIDGTEKGKHFFVRDGDGSFQELPDTHSGQPINWRYLTDDGKVYGTFDGNASFSVLYVWDRHNNIIKLGNLPGKEISAINNLGQVLIRSVAESENGKLIYRPVIWQNGQITKLIGLIDDLGLESIDSSGLGMNNNGDVVGKSKVNIVYKNTVYQQTRPVMWSNGNVIDLYRKIPKAKESEAFAINDLQEMLIRSKSGELYHLQKNETKKTHSDIRNIKNNGYMYAIWGILDKNGHALVTIYGSTDSFKTDYNSIWMSVTKITGINDKGDIIADGETIYGERHGMLFTPATETK